MNNQPTQPQNLTVDPGQFGQYSDWAKENLAKGVSADALNQALQQQPQQTEQPKQSGDFWSTVGGIALPVLGALLAPGTGGVSLLASTALSGIGSAAGKAADEAAAGKELSGGDILGAGLTGAAGNLAGGAIVKGAGKVLKGVVKPAADKAATSLVQGQGQGALDKATADYLYRNGVTDLRQMGQIHPVVTGENGAFSNAVNNSLLNAGEQGTRLDLSSLAAASKGMPGNTVLNAVRDAGIAGDSKSVNSVQQFVQGQLEKYNQDAIKSIPARKGGGVVNSFDNGVLNAQHPIDALNMTKAMDSRAAEWIGSRSPEVQLQGKALRNISNTIKDSLYGEGTAIGKTGITDQVRQTAVDELAPLKEINPTYYQNKVNEINNAGTIGELRTAQKPEVVANQALEFAQNKANTSGGTNIPDLLKVGGPVAGMSVGGPVGMAAGMIAPKVLGSNAANVAGTGTLAKLSKTIGNEKAQKLMDTLGRAGGVLAVNAPNMGAEPTGAISTPNTLQGETMNGGGQPQNRLSDIINAMQSQAILAPQLNPGATSVLSSVAPQLQTNALLQNELGALPAGFANAGGAQGLGGIGSVISGFIPGTAANAYRGEQAAVAAQLAKTLGISPEAAQQLLPSLLQNEQTAGMRQSVLGGMAGALPS